MAAELLAIERVSAGYGEALVLADVSLALEAGEALALLGRNGAGKTTLLTTIMGLTRLTAGRIRLAGQDITRLRTDRRVPAGLGWVPQERNIWASLTVEENLTAVARPGPWTLARAYATFPRLKERRANAGSLLSGGEQQMLAIARALITNPRLLLLDEPLEGLAPIIVQELLRVLQRLIREEGLSAIIVEQHAHQILPLTDRAVVMERGAVAYAGRSNELAREPELLASLLGVADRQPRH